MSNYLPPPNRQPGYPQQPGYQPPFPPPGGGPSPTRPSDGRGLLLSLLALLLLLIIAASSVAQYLQMRANDAKYDEINCLSIAYDFEGQPSEINEVDEQRAELHGCDVAELLRNAPEPAEEEETAE